jgi:hypothetical protein
LALKVPVQHLAQFHQLVVVMVVIQTRQQAQVGQAVVLVVNQQLI